MALFSLKKDSFVFCFLFSPSKIEQQNNDISFRKTESWNITMTVYKIGNISRKAKKKKNQFIFVPSKVASAYLWCLVKQGRHM